VQQTSGVGQLVDDDEAIGGVVERVVNEVGADEAGAAGDQERCHQHQPTTKHTQSRNTRKMNWRSCVSWFRGFRGLNGCSLRILQRQTQLFGQRVDRRAAPLAKELRDRKSTRLNSSHDQISYAVFCLKKKKKKITIQ